VLFLEPGEALDRRQWEEMESFIEGRKPCCAECTVERHLDPQFLASFAWVPTRHLFAECPPELRRYRTREVRLVHTSLLSLVEVHPQIGHPGSLSLKAHPDCPVSSTALSISREPVTANGKAIERPEDFDLFCKGNQVYYDDTLYCPRFIWPHSVYHTIRFHYIPSIIEGLRLGLGNPEIAHFVLAYLIRFRDFETAWKVVQHLPDTWGDRHPMLHISAGTVHFARGDRNRAFKHFRRAVDLRPDSRLIVTNAIKMGILLDRYDDVEAMEEIYRSKSGEAIEDDFVAHFRRIHGPKPMKLATLSLCMIVRDEEENLARTLQSAREISDEMIVVDTGSSDRTVEIAEKAGARVYPFPWGNDFSAARNFAIEKATGDYILMLDGDEHFSPFFFIEAQTLKKLLPTDMACAFWFSIGYYYNESDWLFLLGEAGNFREEGTAIRLFPRLPGIRYTGRISESVEPALRSKGVSIERIPEGSLHIIHEAKNRRERVQRKVHLYGEEKKPDLSMILDAVKDFSCLGNTEQAVYWLRRFYGMPDVDGETRRNMGLRLAGLLELMDREQADGIYEELLAQSDHDGNLMRAYAAFLIRNNCLEKIGGIPFLPKDASQEAQGAVRLEHNCYTALKYFVSGEMENGFLVLESVLDEAAAHLFAQALRFYFLISLGRIDGAVYALDQLFEMTSGPRSDRIETIGDVLRLVTELSDTLLKAGHLRERALVLQGAMTLERVLVKS
jgi:glycosyltransferase involved in cell wall biosynthesis